MLSFEFSTTVTFRIVPTVDASVAVFGAVCVAVFVAKWSVGVLTTVSAVEEGVLSK